MAASLLWVLALCALAVAGADHTEPARPRVLDASPEAPRRGLRPIPHARDGLAAARVRIPGARPARMSRDKRGRFRDQHANVTVTGPTARGFVDVNATAMVMNTTVR